jgi:hypothetical protein
MKIFFFCLIAAVSLSGHLQAGSWTDWIAYKKTASQEVLIITYVYCDYQEDDGDLAQYAGKFTVLMENHGKYRIYFKSPDEMKGVCVLFTGGKIWEYVPGNTSPVQIPENRWGEKIAGFHFAPPYSFFHYPGMESLNGKWGNLCDTGFWTQVRIICGSLVSLKTEIYTWNLPETEESYTFEVISRLINVTFDNDPFDPAELGQD